MEKVYLGIGSNLGKRQENISKALKLVSEKCRIVKVSCLIETEPVGFKKQPMFLNGAALLETELKPKELLLFLKSVEKMIGRVKAIKNGPRAIDLDILFYGNKVIGLKDLIVPHPRMHERRFVLEPLNEISPNKVHPVIGKTVREMLCSL